ncbi:MAG: elongation factor Ts [Bernardetiaceae bacterium]|nr:elongation factor Ts [Bernardetiaceae bacterium]
MAISAKEVNKLRQMTGAGMMDCKKALTESNGDFDAAIDLLRKRGQKLSAKRADRDTTEGMVFSKVLNDGKEAIMVALGCETDFVAKNDDFIKLGETILEKAIETKAADKDALLAVKVNNLTLEDHITEAVGKIGEKIELVSYEHLTGDQVVPYIHSNNKLGVLVSLESVSAGADAETIGKDLGMQIAAMSPISVDESDIDPKVAEKELALGKEKALEEGKPAHIVDKIAEGYLKKFYKENTLLEQSFVKNPSQTIKEYLATDGKGMKVKSFKRIALGA